MREKHQIRAIVRGGPTGWQARLQHDPSRTDWSHTTLVRIQAMPTTPRQISKSQFKTQALALFREIETSGQALVITDHGRLSGPAL